MRRLGCLFLEGANMVLFHAISHQPINRHLTIQDAVLS
jgi:hypothetical protein